MPRIVLPAPPKTKDLLIIGRWENGCIAILANCDGSDEIIYPPVPEINDLLIMGRWENVMIAAAEAKARK